MKTEPKCAYCSAPFLFMETEDGVIFVCPRTRCGLVDSPTAYATYDGALRAARRYEAKAKRLAKAGKK